MSEQIRTQAVFTEPVGAKESVQIKYEPSAKAQVIIRDVFSLFREARDERDRTFEYFDGRDLTTYIDDNVRRYVTNVDERPDIEDWQAIVHLPFTRNKVNAILGKIVDVLPDVEIINRGGEDIMRADIVNTLFEHAEDIDDAEEFFVFIIEEALVKGTAIGYEGLVTEKNAIRNIVRYENDADLTVTESYQTCRKLNSQIVPLEEFYPASVGIRKIKDMPHCFWRKEMTMSKFQVDWGNLPNSKFVQPFSSSIAQATPRQFYVDYITNTTAEGNVELIRFYSRLLDQYVVIANGVWLNPMDGDVVSPLPFNHKKLPFWSIIYDIFGSDFFYGKSLVDRIKALQDVMNVLNNMLLDQSFLTIFSPILMAVEDEIEDDFLRPGRRIGIDTGGLPINQAVMKMDMGVPGNWHQFILDYTKKVLEESSLDQVQSGAAGVGERTTATEIRSAAAGASTLLGLFAKFVKFGLKDRARLRVANILQFYTDPEYPILEGVLGQGGSGIMKDAFNLIRVGSSSLTPGVRGEKIVGLFKDESSLPTKKQLQVDTKIDEKISGFKITKWAITPEYIRDFQYDLKLVPSQKTETSRDIDRALEVQYQTIMNQLYPDLFDRVEGAVELSEKFGRDPRKTLKKDVLNPPTQTLINPKTQALLGGSGGRNPDSTVSGATGIDTSTKNLRSQMTG